MAENKKAYFDYTIIEEYECGLVLQSWEVKAIAGKRCSIQGAHCKVFNGEVFLVGASIGTNDTEGMTRDRKLLMHRKEINRLVGKVQEKGLTLVPLKLYNKDGKFKLSMGLAKGKKEYDKRETEKKRAIENENRRIIKSQKFN